MSIGSRLKDFGENNFTSVTEFAKALDMHRAPLYKYYNDEVMPGGEFLMKLKALGCDLNWLFSDQPAQIREGIAVYGIANIENQRIHELQREIIRLKKLLTKVNNQILEGLKTLESPSPGTPTKVKS